VQPTVDATCIAPHAYFSQTLTPSSWTASDFSKLASELASPLSAINVGIFAKVLPLLLTLNPFGGQIGEGDGPIFDVAFGFGFFLTFGLAVGFFVTFGLVVGFLLTVGLAVGFLLTVGLAVGFLLTVGLVVGFFEGEGAEEVAALEIVDAVEVVSERTRIAMSMRLITIPLEFSD
jgi:hypothetical protein